MAGSSYAYASGRVSGLEGSLLSGRFWHQLFAAEDRADVLRILGETWYGSLMQDEKDIDEVLRSSVSRAEEELAELSLDDDFTNGIILRRDVRNARYIWKSLATQGTDQVDTEPHGIIPVETLARAWSDPGEAESLPAEFIICLEKLQEMKGRPAVELDNELDKLAASVEVSNLGKLKKPLGSLPSVKIELRNFLTAARNRGEENSSATLEKALLHGGYHSVDEVIEAARMNRLSSLLEETVGFEKAAKALEEGFETGSFLSYQRESDLITLDLLEKASADMFSPGPLAAYVLRREMEVAHLKMITAGKTAGIDSRRLKARVPRG